VAPDDLLREAITLAETINTNSPLGVRVTKQVIQINVDAPRSR
jgi:enoyl-CoA hydratase/carnithine racemase